LLVFWNRPNYQFSILSQGEVAGNWGIWYTALVLKIAILGGSFNPVHKGHIFLAETVVGTLGYGLVVLVPAYISPFKQERGDALMRRTEERLSLLLAAVEGRRHLTVDDCELAREGVSYTIDTVDDIVERYRPDGKPGLIIGDDLAKDFPRWRRAGDLAGRCDLIVANRTGAEMPFPHTRLGNAVMPVSSSMVREKMSKGEDWRDLAPERVPVRASESGSRALPGDTSRDLSRRDVLRRDISRRIEREVRGMLPAGRFLHSRNVALTACALAARFGIDEDDAFLAGIAHDMAKEVSTPLEHGAAAAEILEKSFGVTNEDVLEAVRCHTEGRTGMGDLAKIVYIADKIEPRRKTVEPRLRELGKTAPLDALFVEIVRGTHEHLERKGVVISENARLLLQHLEKAAIK
jgi:nicotinate-nucleotide adenylyltransferase